MVPPATGERFGEFVKVLYKIPERRAAASGKGKEERPG
jgi:hypothetical protein